MFSAIAAAHPKSSIGHEKIEIIQLIQFISEQQPDGVGRSQRVKVSSWLKDRCIPSLDVDRGAIVVLNIACRIRSGLQPPSEATIQNFKKYSPDEEIPTKVMRYREAHFAYRVDLDGKVVEHSLSPIRTSSSSLVNPRLLSPEELAGWANTFGLDEFEHRKATVTYRSAGVVRVMEFNPKFDHGFQLGETPRGVRIFLMSIALFKQRISGHGLDDGVYQVYYVSRSNEVIARRQAERNILMEAMTGDLYELHAERSDRNMENPPAIRIWRLRP